MKNISLFFSALVALLFSVAETSAQITPPYYNPANVNITGGNINGTTIGGTTPAAGTFTTATANTLFTVGSGSTTNAGLIAGYHGTSGYGALWSTGFTPSTTNDSFRTNGTFTSINGVNASYLRVSSAVGLQVDANSVSTPYTLDATSTTAASLKTAGGLGVAKKAYFGDSLNSAKDIKFTSSNLGAATDYYIGNYLTNLVYNAPTGSGHNWAINNNDTMALNASGLTIANGKTLQVGSGSTTSAGLIAGYLGSSGYGAIWSTGVTPSITNYSFASNGAVTACSGSTNSNLNVNSVARVSANTTGVTFAGNMIYDKTITAAGTTGAQTINKTTGRVNFAAAATSLVVTNSLATANSICHATAATNDATGYVKNCVAAAGSITINVVAPTAEMAVNFTVTN